MTGEQGVQGGSREDAGDESEAISLRPVDDRHWSRILEGIPDAPPFYRPPWLDRLAEQFRATSLRLAVMYGQEPIGLCPLFVVRRRGARAVVSPPPVSWTPYQGPVWRESAVVRERVRLDVFEGFVEGVERVAAAERASRVFLRLSPQMYDVRAFLWRGFECCLRYSFLRDLDEEPAPDGTHARELANRAGAIVETGSIADIDRLLGEASSALRTRGAAPAAFAREVPPQLPPDDAELLVARRGPTPVEGAVVVYGATGVVCSLLPLPVQRMDGALIALVLDDAIRRARVRGLRRFELTDDAGLDPETLSRLGLRPLPYFEVFKARGLARAMAFRSGPGR